MSNFILQVKLLLCRLQSPLFIIHVSSGVVTVAKGKITNSFLVDCKEIIERHDISFGLIYALPVQSGKPVLQASSEIKADALQQLRNTWGFNA